MMMHEGPMEVTGGYFIRRAGPIPARQPARNSGRTPFDNRENLDPLTGRVIGSTRQKRSPLPEWYPRVPLKDITALIQAIERRDQRREEERAASLQSPPMAPPPIQTPEPAATNQIASFTSPLVAPPPDLTPEQREQEKKLTESLEKIEKMVRKNLKRDLKKTKEVKSNKTLMSMR